MAEGTDTKENLIILRDVCYTITILHQRTIAGKHSMMGNWNLLEDREGKKGERQRERERENRNEGRNRETKK